LGFKVFVVEMSDDPAGRGKRGNTNKRKRDEASSDDPDEESASSLDKKRIAPATKRFKTGEFKLLSRDELLELSSQEFEDYAILLAQHHALTPAEERELKKQRRLIKNRESAQLSRKRKKNYIEELEGKLQGLEGENVNLRHELASLSVKNSQLRGEVTYLNDMIEKSSLAGAFEDLGETPNGAEQSNTVALHDAGNSTPTSALDAVETLARAHSLRNHSVTTSSVSPLPHNTRRRYNDGDVEMTDARK